MADAAEIPISPHALRRIRKDAKQQYLEKVRRQQEKDDRLGQALRASLQEGKTLEAVADEWDVPLRTLARRRARFLKSGVPVEQFKPTKPGRRAVLTPEDESEIVHTINIKGKDHVPLTKAELSEFIASWTIIARAADPDSVPIEWRQNHRVSPEFTRDFLNSHKEVVAVKRGKSMTHHRHLFVSDVSLDSRRFCFWSQTGNEDALV